MKKLSFSSITLNALRQVVPIRQKVDDTRFEEWFNNDFDLQDDEKELLSYLTKKHRPYFSIYSEEELKAKFITPILNKIDYNVGDIKDWYERPIRTIINNTEIGGYTDYMIAKGEDEPELPYFFIQEFKPSVSATAPENQLLAELIVALSINQQNEIKGATVQGQYWKFMILEKNKEEWQYFISKSFDAADISDLENIYKHLLFIKKMTSI